MTELSDDIEVIGPGQMLREGRIRMGYSVDDVAKKLNFRVTLVKELEAESFDANVPVTFTRGYLKNYAKLVEVPIDEVLASFEMLEVAKTQGAEMQSFSKQTKKQAENNRIMLLSYFVVAVLVVLTVIWWYQDAAKKNANLPFITPQNVSESPQVTETSAQTPEQQDAFDDLVASVAEDSSIDGIQENPSELTLPESVDYADSELVVNDIEEKVASTVKVEFTFSGDCWVNIIDAAGERIAYGMKKEGYVMTIEGEPPFNVTLGRPELVSIIFDNAPVDTSMFSPGNIAKFELPLSES